VVRDLLENGAKVNLTTSDSKTALHIACENDNLNVIQLLLDNQANINLTTFDGWTALHFSVYYNNPTIVQYLLENHPNLNKKNKEGLSVLDIAYKMRYDDIVKLLIDHFLTIDEKTNKIILLDKFNHQREEDEEIKSNSDSNSIKKGKSKNKSSKSNNNNNNSKRSTVSDSDSDSDSDSNNNSDSDSDSDSDGGSISNEITTESEILINEIKKNHFINAINIIESQKIALEYIDKNGWTALHWASYKGNVDIVKRLIHHNVKIQRKTRYGLHHTDEYKGKTAKEIAEIRYHFEVVDVIQAKVYKKRANIVLNVLTKAHELLS